MPKKELTPEEALKRAVQFSERYVARGPYKFFPEPDVVKVVQQGLADNEARHGYRYCP
jgi:ferredoxin-thioredoxin reductase catalytic subunit